MYPPGGQRPPLPRSVRAELRAAYLRHPGWNAGRMWGPRGVRFPELPFLALGALANTIALYAVSVIIVGLRLGDGLSVPWILVGGVASTATAMLMVAIPSLGMINKARDDGLVKGELSRIAGFSTVVQVTCWLIVVLVLLLVVRGPDSWHPVARWISLAVACGAIITPSLLCRALRLIVLDLLFILSGWNEPGHTGNQTVTD